MSGLIGYKISNGTDLSPVFVSSNNPTFSSAINTSAGIIGPSSSISYTSDMIGYTTTIFGDYTGSPSSGVITALTTTGFTLPVGVYIMVAYVTNTYSGWPVLQ